MKKIITILLMIPSLVFANGIKLTEYTEFNNFVKSQNGTFILINRGSQELIVFENNIQVLDMKVIVGKRGWRTPLKETYITNIITNPAWSVPQSIVPEQLRKINKNPEKYKKRGYNVTVTAEGETKIIQLAGASNVLGKVKFKLADIGNIYMHDTSGKYLFKKEKRKLSHGCIRLEKPIILMNIVNPSIEYKRSRYPKWYKLEEQWPVHIVDWGIQTNG